jgi:hypothetical protein
MIDDLFIEMDSSQLEWFGEDADMELATVKGERRVHIFIFLGVGIMWVFYLFYHRQNAIYFHGRFVCRKIEKRKGKIS